MFDRAVRSSGRCFLSVLIISSYSGLKPGRHPVLTHTSFSIRK
uniref:Uncharacterized protein n=1 Tax=Rhizophora mucronata TaxID=61149 RepID=A0A2P2QPS9_RHIMU